MRMALVFASLLICKTSIIILTSPSRLTACHCPGCGTQHPQRFACVLLAAAPTATPCFRHWRRSSLLLLPRGGLGIAENFSSSPVAPPLGELSAKQTERATLFYHFLSQNSKNFGKAIDFMKLKCYAMSMLNHFTILKFAIRKHQRQGGLISPAVPEQEKENPP